MIKRNMSLNINEPFLLQPAGKDYLWGGTRLKDDFGKTLELTPLAETWECSVHPDGESVVASGPFAGQQLGGVLMQHPEFLGSHPGVSMPILIKLIDAKRDLSVQVHPDDSYAATNENGQLGKTEMWYVLDAVADAQLIYGFTRDLTPAVVRDSIRAGTIGKFLRRVPVRKDDVFLIPPGQVHAICAGALIAEIQENSNLTYRLFDYNRLDKNGKRRELHIEKALEVADLKAGTDFSQPVRVKHFHRGYATELLCNCKYFQVERMLLNTEKIHGMADFQTGSNTFQAFLCIGGCGGIFWKNKVLPFYQGDCIFVPADSVMLQLHGKAQFLKVGC